MWLLVRVALSVLDLHRLAPLSRYVSRMSGSGYSWAKESLRLEILGLLFLQHVNNVTLRIRQREAEHRDAVVSRRKNSLAVRAIFGQGVGVCNMMIFGGLFTRRVVEKTYVICCV